MGDGAFINELTIRTESENKRKKSSIFLEKDQEKREPKCR